MGLPAKHVWHRVHLHILTDYFHFMRVTGAFRLLDTQLPLAHRLVAPLLEQHANVPVDLPPPEGRLHDALAPGPSDALAPGPSHREAVPGADQHPRAREGGAPAAAATPAVPSLPRRVMKQVARVHLS